MPQQNTWREKKKDEKDVGVHLIMQIDKIHV
jgi:hypothetical protein